MNDFTVKNVQNLCRICLMENLEMTPLRNCINNQKLTLFETLESIVSTQITKEEKYPQSICESCLSILKLSFDLISTFNNSQEKLKKYFEEETQKLTEQESCVETENLSIIVEGSSSKEDVFFLVESSSSESDIYEVPDDDSISSSNEEIMQLITKSTKKGPENPTDSSKKPIVLGHLCPICQKPYLTELGMKKHVKAVHEENKDRPESLKDLFTKNKGICPCCDKKFASESGFKNHFTICFKNGELCQQCGHLSKSRYQALRHQQLHTGKVHECNICHKKFYSLEYLRIHKTYHNFKREHLCVTCGNVFLHPRALALHMKKHGEWEHICSFCNKKFYIKSSLTTHLRTHTGERPFACSFPNCNKKFRVSKARQRHEYTHTGYKPFVCKYCEKKFATKYHLNMHYLTHKGPYLCDICNKSFIEFQFLKLHSEKCHNELEETVPTTNS